MIKNVFLSFVFLFLYFVAPAQKMVVLDTTNIIEVQPSEVKYLEDKSLKMSIEEVVGQEKNFNILPKKIIGFSYTNSVYWLRMAIKNPHYKDRENDFIMDIGLAILDYVDLYHFDKIQNKWVEYKAGDRYAFNKRKFKIRNIIFPLPFSSTESETFYVRIQTTSSLIATPKIAREKVLLVENTYIESIYAFFYGILAVTFLYNLFLFLTLKDKNYLFYILNIFSGILFFMGYVGHATVYLFPNSPIIANQMQPFGASLLAATGTIFMHNFLEVKKYSKPATYLTIFTISLAGIFVILSVVLGENAGKLSRYVNLLALLSVVNALAVPIYLFRKNPNAKGYLLAFAFYITGVLSMVLRNAGIIPLNAITQFVGEIGIALEIIILAFALSNRYNRYRKEKNQAITEMLKVQQEANENLEQKVTERTFELREAVEELNQTNEELQTNIDIVQAQHNLIEEKNRSIVASINYSKFIQSAILPLGAYLNTLVSDHFILFKPKDIVSGDFYWAKKVNDRDIIIVADCTGHGVPGALMSMVGSNLLNDIVVTQQTVEPDEILAKLRKGINQTLQQKDTFNQDGMDIAICSIDHAQRTIHFAGAHNGLLYIKQEKGAEEVCQYIKGDNIPVGGDNHYNANAPFTKKTIQLEPNEKGYFYMFSDGYQDQFGGEKGRKILAKPFHSLIVEGHNLKMEMQKKRLELYLNQWIGTSHKQIDDILVMGFTIDKA